MAQARFGSLLDAPGLIGRAIRVGGIVLAYAVVSGPVVLGARVRRRRWASAGESLSSLLIALGPSYVKIGQLLSTRRDLLPERVCAALGRLADATPPPRRSRLEQAVRSAYQGRSWPFADFVWAPIATGSIATVHRAVTLDGRRVAVKVRRPGISRTMRQDFRLTGFAMKAVSWLPMFRSMPVSVMHAQVGGAILRQLDLEAEAAALSDLRTNLRGLSWLRIPEPFPECSAEGVLVMEYLEGLVRVDPESLAREARTAAARRVMSAVYEMLFIDGLVHCDLHPGNLYIHGDGSLAMLDAGFVIKLSEQVRASFADFFINLAMGNGPVCAEIMIESSASVADGCDLDGFRAGLIELVKNSTGARSGEFNLAKFAGRLFSLQRDYELFPVPEFAFPLLSLLVVEGIVQGLYPELDFQEEATPVLRRRNMPRSLIDS